MIFAKTQKCAFFRGLREKIGVKTNYNIKQISTNNVSKSSTSTNRRSTRNSNIITTTNNIETIKNNNLGSILSGYVRCYVEDYMSMKQHTSIRVLFPSNQVIFENHQPIHQLQLSNLKYNVFDCIIDTAPNHDWIKQSLTYTDMKHALTRGNFGSYIIVNDDKVENERGESILLTWREVMLGKSKGVQV